MDGRSFLPLLQGESIPVAGPHPVRVPLGVEFSGHADDFRHPDGRYKYIYYHGVWDHDGFYDLQTDPHERHNLINVPAYQERIAELQRQLFTELDGRGGLLLPIRPPAGERLDQRKLSKHRPRNNCQVPFCPSPLLPSPANRFAAGEGRQRDSYFQADAK